ncbi:toxin-antitoxin system HicB family antitoxin [Fictibacillus aquaticus]|uniref:type II toxin-antitoxin system HicB family antitoxin n=1 Tax=Fictibacillus aquaticus TaxID=2021314 RepID=UPI00197A82AC|nr:type II toxin-antitoxin system HicB family antitoxin [Fictibacillus aquaticus]
MAKELSYYQELEYKIEINPLSEEDGGGWLASHPDLNGCIADGESPEEAINNLKDAKTIWLMTAIKRGIEIPVPKHTVEEYSGKFTLRLPKSLHRELAETSREEGISLNQYLLSVISQRFSQKNLLNEVQKMISNNVNNSIHVIVDSSHHKGMDIPVRIDSYDDWEPFIQQSYKKNQPHFGRQ